MGDLHVLLPSEGVFLEESQLPSPSPSSSNLQPASISDENWNRAEQATHEIICRIQPTVVSERRRKVVVEYLQNLIKAYLGCEVFPFGSVPLKTYLPDGDIDLTTLAHLNVEDALANDVHALLERMEQNKEADFEVKDVQFIHAEVKLVKCLVQNIVVDISFNQLGGLCTLCFLEKVDRLIGKEHLFKRSIILIKAWCYYESRILGAHHGLISTYALETLVLYIFHLFHTSLHGPLEVLYRFLDYFSKFDWDNHGVSINGPIALSSFPNIVVEAPETDASNLLLSKDFLRKCTDSFSVPLKANEMHMRSFPQKHLNIVDPLKEHNNLGRSVSKGNYYRIRSAFGFGSRRLGRILASSGEQMEDELKKFFLNTLERHGSGQRPDVQDCFPICRDCILHSTNLSDSTSSKPKVDSSESKMVSTFSLAESNSVIGKDINDDHVMLNEEISHIKISGSENIDAAKDQMVSCFSHHHASRNDKLRSDMKHGSVTDLGSDFSFHSPEENEEHKCDVLIQPLATELICNKEKSTVSSSRLSGDARDLASSRILSAGSTNEFCKPSTIANELSTASFSGAHHAPHPYSQPFKEMQKSASVNLVELKESKSMVHMNGASSGPQSPHEQQPDHGLKPGSNTGFRSWSNEAALTNDNLSGSVVSLGMNTHPSETLCQANESSVGIVNNYNFKERDSTNHSQYHVEDSDSLSDLCADYDCHFQSLLYGRWCHEYNLYGSFIQVPLHSPSPHNNKYSWDALQQTHMKQSMFPRINSNGMVSGPLFPTGYYPVNSSLIHGSFSLEEMPKPRGTGTYFPNTNHHSYRDRTFGRARYPYASNNQLNRPRNGRYMSLSDSMSFSDSGSHEFRSQAPASQLVFPGVNGRGKSNQVDFVSYNHSLRGGFSPTNGCTPPIERPEFGSLGSMQLSSADTSDQGQQLESGVHHAQGSTLVLPSAMPRPEPNMNRERAPQLYHLKDEEDFPPLSS